MSSKSCSVKLSDVVTQYDGVSSGDFSRWIEKVELVSTLQGIKELETFLPLFLSGGAFEVYRMLPDTVKKDYAELRKSLLQAFSSDPVNAYEEFNARKLRPGESVDVFLADLRRLAGLVDSSAGDQWLKCAFIAGLPDHLRSQLRAACSVNAMSLEDVLDRARTLLKSSETCMVSAVRRTVVTCYSCGERGHVRRLCPKNSTPCSLEFDRSASAGKLSRDVSRCFVCGDPSHVAPACPNRFRVGGPKNE